MIQQCGSILPEANLSPRACLPVDTNIPHLRNHLPCGADKHGPKRLLRLRLAAPIRELWSSRLLRPTTSRKARGLALVVDRRPTEIRGIVASS